MSSAIRFEIDGDGVATLYWQLQGAANVLHPGTLRDLEAAIDRVMVTPAIKGALLTGTGEQFVGGLDLAWLLDAVPAWIMDPVSAYRLVTTPVNGAVILE